jgi:hypothetical protein
MLKSNLARRLERLEAGGQDRVPVYVWIDRKGDAEHLAAEAARNNPDRKIITVSWRPGVQ